MSDAWSLESVLQLRDAMPAGEAAAPERDERYHAAAGLLSSFAIVPDVHTGAAGANLVADSVPLREGSTRRTLKTSVRRRVLKQLHTRDALLKALHETADRPDDPLQRALEECLTGSRKPLAGQTSEELAASMQAIDWLGATELKESLPSLDAIRQRIERMGLLDPLQALAGSNFKGRTTELATLARYVESGSADQRPMLVFGPGGMGKSSLIARFVLDRIGDLPVVYLDCDRPGLAPQEPVTFLAEAVRQLGLQFDAHRSTAETLRGEWLRTLTQASNTNTRGRAGALDEFRGFVDDLHLVQSPLLFAIDTFEEVQYRSRAVARKVAGFLDELRQRLPRLRALIAGRNPAADFAVMPLELGELDQEAARGLLDALGVGSEVVQRRLARLLHGNPLSLRLAASILKADESKGLDDLENLTDDTAIQGVLYGRILGHIHQPDVRKIAHPGLVLRRITAGLIRDVLAKACGVPMDDPQYADMLFALLRSELSLVTPEGRDAVRHRADVRRVMLEPLRKDQKAVVRAIEEQAVEYYAPFDDAVSRAEEIYHRLSLGQPGAVIDERWLPGIEDSLRSAVDELPQAARAYLAARLGVELYDQDWDAVDQATWEAYAARHAGDLLQLDRPLEAARLLRRRSARSPGSPLYWLQAQALRRGGQLLESHEIARQALAQLTDDPISVPLLEWFTGPELTAAPSAGEVNLYIARLDVLAPLRALADATFVGREWETAALAAYVFARGTSARGLQSVVGPPGIGKSALVARVALNAGRDLDLVYLNLRLLATTRPAPAALLDLIWEEMFRQLIIVRPNLRDVATPGRPIDADELERCFTVMGDATRPLLMVIEEADELYNRRSTAERLYDALEGFQGRASGLRVVLVSRVAPSRPNLQILELAGLPAEAADALLSRLAIQSAGARQKVAALAGSSPLTLKLAAEIVQQSGAAALDSIPADVDIAPYLLDRLLNHIPGVELRALARGALAVRRVTAEIIEHVLAGPCQLIVESRGRADELLELLVHETGFFTQADPGVVRPRSDLRGLFRKLAANERSLVRGIDEAAVAFYETANGPEFRAEEIYHRLLLGQSREDIDARWMDGVAPYLQDVAREVSSDFRIYLAGRLGLGDVEIGLATAGQTTWEEYVARQAARLVAMGQLSDALELVRQRSTRLRRSPLYALETQILLSMARLPEALAVGRRGLELWPDDKKLLAVVAAAEQTLGSEQTSTETGGAAASTPSAFYLLGDVHPEAVLEVLKIVLPTSTDARNAFRSLQGLPAATATGDLEEMVSWAAAAGRMDELVTAAAAHAPLSPVLGAFLARSAMRVDSAGVDAVTKVLLQNGEVFLNRQVLRDFLRGLISRDARSRVLVVDGPPGSGKSYTGVLADSVARATRRLEYRRFEPRTLEEPLELVRSIFDAYRWRSDTLPSAPMGSFAEENRALAYVMRRKAQESQAIVLLHVDFREQPRPETTEFLRTLVDDSGLALILSGLSTQFLTSDWRGMAVEDLAKLLRADVEDGLARVFRELNKPITEAAIDQLATSVLKHAAGGPGFNARVNSALKRLVANFTG